MSDMEWQSYRSAWKIRGMREPVFQEKGLPCPFSSPEESQAHRTASTPLVPDPPGPAAPPARERAASLIRRLNIAGVCSLSRRLMAVERARVLGRQPVDLRTYSLEQEARRWREGRAIPPATADLPLRGSPGPGGSGMTGKSPEATGGLGMMGKSLEAMGGLGT